MSRPMEPRPDDDLRAALIEHSPLGPTAERRLQAVVRDGVLHPGKLARGRLVQTIANVLGVPPAPAVTIATAIEYFHLASLLLDDLPCMDNAHTRRGRPCAHVAQGEAAAIVDLSEQKLRGPRDDGTGRGRGVVRAGGASRGDGG